MRRRRFSAVLAILAILAVLAVEVGEAATERVTLRTDDGLSLAATWYEPPFRPAPAVILVHMLNRSHREWDELAQRLASAGIGALAFDLRGHGESAGSVASGDGTQADYSAMVLDVKAARRFLAERPGVQQSRVGLAGASLGANLAALEASSDASVASLALLSPSLDYRGLRIEAAVRKIGERPVLLVAGDDDPYALMSAKDLQKAGEGLRELLVLSQAGHGSSMLARNPDLVRTLVDWFRRTLL